jgi:hypothetical protein
MGCGCGKSKNLNKQSSRMPKKIGGINVPPHMSPNQRKATMTKIQNAKKAKQVKSKKEWEDYLNENL